MSASGIVHLKEHIMPDMLVKLYELKDNWGFIAKQ